MVDVGKVYIIVLEENLHRKANHIRERLRKIPFTREPEIEFFNAIDGRRITMDYLLRQGIRAYPFWPMETDNSWWNRPLKPGELGCSLSHLSIWEKAYNEGHDRILILEEDFDVVGDHFHVLKTDEPWHLFYLGRKKLKEDKQISKHLVHPDYSYCSHAYMLSKSGMQTFLKSNFRQNIIPVDEFLPALYANHPRKDIRDLFKHSRISALAPIRNLIMQHHSDTSSTEEFVSETDTDFDYVPLHPQLFAGYDKDLPDWISRYVNPLLIQREFDLICDEPIKNVYLFPVFNSIFCKELIEEAENYGQWTMNRHKNFPTNDMLLSKFGLDLIYSYIIKRFVYPLCMHKYQTGADVLNFKSENFIARYMPEQQGHLSLHNDASILSLILTLNTDYEGGGTYFPKFQTLVKPERAGYMSVHPGQIGYLHGARPVVSGKRYIVASFLR